MKHNLTSALLVALLVGAGVLSYDRIAVAAAFEGGQPLNSTVEMSWL